MFTLLCYYVVLDINNYDLEGYYGTNINTFGLSYSHSSDKLNIYNTHTQLH